MTDATAPAAVPSGAGQGSLLAKDTRTAKRNAAEARFRNYGLVAVCTGILMLVLLLASILSNGLSAFQQTTIELQIELPAERLDPEGDRNPVDMAKVTTFGYAPLLRDALVADHRARGHRHRGRPAGRGRPDLRRVGRAASQFRSGQPGARGRRRSPSRCWPRGVSTASTRAA